MRTSNTATWNRMSHCLNPVQLQAYLTVLKTGSMTRASELLNLSQPSVSRQIADLEDRLGFQLFYRKGARIFPTKDGLLLQSEAESYLAQAGKIDRMAQEIRWAKSSEFVAISNPACAVGITPDVLLRMRANNPNVRMSLFTVHSLEISPWLRSQRANIGLGYGKVGTPGITVDVAYELSCVVMVPENHRFASQEVIDLEELVDERLIASGLEDQMAGVVPSKLIEALEMSASVRTASAYVACQYVRKGLGISIVDPLTANAVSETGMVLCPTFPKIPYPVYIAHASNYQMSPIDIEFISLCRTFVSESGRFDILSEVRHQGTD